MTDIDTCIGGNCKLKDACFRYHEHLRLNAPYPMNPIEDCPMFNPMPYYGN